MCLLELACAGVTGVGDVVREGQVLGGWCKCFVRAEAVPGGLTTSIAPAATRSSSCWVNSSTPQLVYPTSSLPEPCMRVWFPCSCRCGSCQSP